MSMAADSIEALRAELAEQILRLAIASDNPQYKVDAFKATERYGKSAAKAPGGEAAAGGMAVFHARLRQAQRPDRSEEGGSAGVNGDADEPAAPDR